MQDDLKVFLLYTPPLPPPPLPSSSPPLLPPPLAEADLDALQLSGVGGEDIGVHLKLLSLLENPAVVVAAAAAGDTSTLREYLSKHPSAVSRGAYSVSMEGEKGGGGGLWR